jgi:hypothetical protein
MVIEAKALLELRRASAPCYRRVGLPSGFAPQDRGNGWSAVDLSWQVEKLIS